MSRSNTLRLHLLIRAANGLHTGRIPLGYLPGKEEGAPAVPDPEVLPFILEVRKLWREKKVSIAGAQELLTKQGVRSYRGRMLGRSSVYALLTNPYYEGWVRYQRTLILGKHEILNISSPRRSHAVYSRGGG